jgi:hypothetical protein
VTHRVTIRLDGDNSATETFDENVPIQNSCINIFTNYKNNNWIESYTETIIDSSTKNEIIDFDNADRWVAYRAELQAITGDSDVSVFTSTVVSAVDV